MSYLSTAGPREGRSLAPPDRAAMREYWGFYEPRSASISDAVQRSMAAHPEGKSAVDVVATRRILEQQRRDSLLQHDAIMEDRWAPYIACLREEGSRYALTGASYLTWFDRIKTFRDVFRSHVATFLRENLEPDNVNLAVTASHGLDRVHDVIVETISEAYFATKESLTVATEQSYRSMFDHSPLPMWTFDRETLRFVAVNEAALRHYGYSREQFAMMTLADIRPPEDVAAFRQDVAHAEGLTDPGTWRHRKNDGSIINVEVRANDFVMEGRKVRLVLINDVTERDQTREALHKAEQQLRHAQKMDAIGQLAGGVAHDFNNVLTVIEGYACMLGETLEPGDSRHNDVAAIRRTAHRATEVTRQLLAVSRHSIAAPRSVSLAEIIAQFTPMLKHLIGERITIVTCDGKVPPVIADPGQIEQVLMNLAVNARDAMSGVGRLTIETELVHVDAESAGVRGCQPGTYAVVAVTDTGAGMDRDTQARVFEPFFTTKEAGKGTGLGLSIVHGIVTQAGGTISLYSEPGHGTTFRIQLPVARETVVVPQPNVFVAPRVLPPVTVLVVDDQGDVRAVTTRVLHDAGCQVLEAATAHDARRICVSHEGSIDVAVLDVVLGDGRGDQLARQLRDLRSSIKVIMMSGYPAGALSPNGATPRDLLAKPFTPPELRAAVARALGLEPGAGSAPSKRISPEAKHHERVLVVDDDHQFRRIIVGTLRTADFEVVDVDSGQKAVSELESGSFDVVLSDVDMPEDEGLDLIRAVRRVDLDVPVILMTGSPDVQSAATAVEYGAFRYLTKPVELTAIAKTIRHASRVHALARLRREAFSMSGTHVGAVDRAGLEVRFDQAIDRLWMAYQPIFDARTGALFGVEALLRSNEPLMPGPQHVLDAATQLGLLPRLGRRTRALAASAMASRDDGLALFVNLHPEDLSDLDLVAADAPLTKIASRVILEITERATLGSLPELTTRIARLRALGFRVAVDDIGAGYSSLQSFTELMPEVVKIDMSLVRDVHLSAVKQRTISALCKLCHEGGCLVVGEGVETVQESECMVSLGCDLLQGYLLGRPSRELPAI